VYLALKQARHLRILLTLNRVGWTAISTTVMRYFRRPEGSTIEFITVDAVELDGNVCFPSSSR